MLKLIDSTTYIGRAEQELKFSADFERFVNRGFDLEAIKAVDIFEIQKKYNLKGFTFGNYVTQEERYFFLYVLSKQLEALATIAKTNDLGHGVLKIGFGADGSPGSAAHFQPAHNFINLNRGRKTDYKSYLQGQQSFTHEYLHYLDYKQGRADLNIAHNAASETIKDSSPAASLKTRLFAEFIRELYEDDEFKAEIQKLKPFTMSYWFSPVEIAARAFEAAIQSHVHATLPALKKYFIEDYTSPVYPSNSLIKKYDLINQAVKILRGESWSKAQEPAKLPYKPGTSEYQRVKNAVDEGMLFLKAGTMNGQKLSPEKLQVIYNQVLKDKAKIADTSLTPAAALLDNNKIDFINNWSFIFRAIQIAKLSNLSLELFYDVEEYPTAPKHYIDFKKFCKPFFRNFKNNADLKLEVIKPPKVKTTIKGDSFNDIISQYNEAAKEQKPDFNINETSKNLISLSTKKLNLSNLDIKIIEKLAKSAAQLNKSDNIKLEHVAEGLHYVSNKFYLKDRNVLSLEYPGSPKAETRA